jgi:hypothetical protein
LELRAKMQGHFVHVEALGFEAIDEALDRSEGE